MTGLSISAPRISTTVLHQMASSEKKSVNVLCLDGGGVRGLSTLIILRTLLCLINEILNPDNHDGKPMHPSEVFDLIVGTSTGGLIALMMVKFNLGVDDCIKKYKKLSRKIFKQWHVLGKFSGGFGTVKKFSSKNLEKVLIKHVITPSLEGRDVAATEYLMEQIESHPDLMCSVVCREIYTTTKQRTPRTVFLCSHWDVTDSSSPLVCNSCCRAQYHDLNQSEKVRVVDAARATSAAPTYFKYVKLLGTLLVDGGFGDTNNPSQAAYLHYFFDPAQYESIQMVNIGTGTEPERQTGWQPPKSFPVDYLPWLQGVARTTKDLATLATESERVGANMRTLAKMSPQGVLKFDRFSANREDIHQIRLYKYGQIGEIERITNDYLKDEAVMMQLRRLAEQLADTCRARREKANSPAPPSDQVSVPVALEAEPESSSGQAAEGSRSSFDYDHDEDHGDHQGDHLSAPGNAPGLTDTSSCGSCEMPPTPHRQGPLRGILARCGRQPRTEVLAVA